MPSALRVAVVIATKGRPQAVSRLLGLLERQTMRPATVVLSAADRSDLETTLDTQLSVQCIFGEAGLTKQRNRGLERVQEACDLVVFFDDDFAPAANWLELCAEIFHTEPEVVGVTGAVLRDGAHSDQLSWNEAERVLEEARPAVSAQQKLIE